MFEDEAGFGRINKPKYCWCTKGVRPLVPCHAEGFASSEHAVTIVSRDGAMPYDREAVLQLKRLAEGEGIPYRIDAYINYASDASVSVKSGKDVRALCFGPGAEATHHYERTHLDAVDATVRLLAAYLQAELA